MDAMFSLSFTHIQISKYNFKNLEKKPYKSSLVFALPSKQWEVTKSGGPYVSTNLICF